MSERLERHFLFLQGPHGPFFRELAGALAAAGAQVSRLGFNQGDAYEWSKAWSYTPFNQPLATLPEFLAFHFRSRKITDLVLYGDTRPRHRLALEAARRAGVRTHILEEGYLRPYWITYERQGANGYSRLTKLNLADIDAETARLRTVDEPTPPAKWGSTRQHVAQSLRYHFQVWTRNGAYGHYERHRELTLTQELLIWLRRVARRPWDIGRRSMVERRLKADSRPSFMILLQLGFDPSMSAHSSFRNIREVVDSCMRSFAEALPEMDPQTILIFKAHPLEDGRERLHRFIPELARRHKLEDRVVFVDGGGLAELLDRPSLQGVATVNSTAAHQALMRKLPTKALGRAIYDKPGLTSRRADLKSFFTDPDAPDKHAYHLFQRFLKATSQIKGGFYADDDREACMGRLVGMMLADEDPYGPCLGPSAREGWSEAAE